MTTTLYWRAADNVTLTEALSATAGALTNDAIGLISTTAWHGFVRRRAVDLHTPERAVNLDEVFEACVFDGTVELRWLNEHDGVGRAVLLAEDRPRVAGAMAPFDEQHDEQVAGTCDQQLMLWGQPTVPANDWVTLREHRIGCLPVPGLGSPPTANSHDPVLWLREYITMDSHGNAYVLDERLRGLGWAPVRGNEKSS